MPTTITRAQLTTDIVLAGVFAVVCLPFALLGARNLMAGHVASWAVYGLVRMTMNVLRAIEPFILVVVFVVWVGAGPFAGMLALTVHTVAALTRMVLYRVQAGPDRHAKALPAWPA